MARDSAGIRIVENAAPVGPMITIDSLPIVDIGPEDGPKSEIQTSPVFAVRMNDGRIAATSWARNEFTIFDADGRWVRTVGRLGSGPGEFQGLGFLFRSATDTLVTFEPENLRVQRWTTDGDNVDLAPLLPQGGRLGAWIDGVTDEGAILLRTRRPDPSTDTKLTIGGTVTLFRLASLGAAWDSLFSFAGVPSVKHPADPRFTFATPFFAPAPSWHQRGRMLAFTSGDAFQIEIRDLDGKLRTITRRPSQPRPITDVEVAEAGERVRDELHGDNKEPFVRQLLNASPNRVRAPVGSVMVAGDHRIWAMEGDRYLGETIRASIFDSTGVWESEVSLPKDLTIHQIDADGILGSIGDDQGYQHLKFFRYHRTPR